MPRHYSADVGAVAPWLKTVNIQLAGQIGRQALNAIGDCRLVLVAGGGVRLLHEEVIW